MIEAFHIQNFRALRNVQVPLRPLTVLIGPNDSGKSAFLNALQKMVRGEGLDITDFWRGNNNIPIRISAKVGPHWIHSEAAASGSRIPGIPEMRPSGFYQLPARGVEMLSAGRSDNVGPPEIDMHGNFVPALFDYLFRQERERFSEVESALKSLVPGLERVNIGVPDPSSRRIDLVIENGYRMPADRASAGVRLLITFVALAYHPEPPKLILLEEPETGIHPRRLADVVNLLSEISEGKHGGQAAQVVMTTHSPYLLDFVNLDRDQVLVFRRQNDGSRSAEPADKDRLATFLDEFKLGEVWYNRGEEGLLPKK